MISLKEKSALGGNRYADSVKPGKVYFRPKNKKIQPFFPAKGSPLFCSFDECIARYVNRVGYCYFLKYRNYSIYDLSVYKGKEIWILYLNCLNRQLSIDLGYALLRSGAIKVLILHFVLGDIK